MTEAPILEVRNLSKTYRVRRSIGLVETIKAAQDISFAVERGRTLGIVGESGSGKSTVARCLLGLTPLTEGEVLLDESPLGGLGVRKMRSHRRMMQMVFQMPQASFDPTRTVRSSVAQPLRRLRPDMSKPQQEDRLRHVLTAVSLGEELWDRKPRALSGGQLQRAAIARALAPDPELVVLDEPTSSLDLSVRGDILSLLQELQEEFNVAFVLISHDLEAVRVCAHDVIVMYLGQIVEQGTAEQVFGSPAHPYTQALMAASKFETDSFELGPKGETDPTKGCRLMPRCPLAESACSTEQALVPSGQEGRMVRCWKAVEE
ncbi:MAG: ABC transporter ATP-binding protein [Acidimicrobiia bacterium]|nr:ABC transporter ATP-binding protein [bacterium]MXZ06219.1 ABC transporter ATP-binding protein [Acidimicrobiia bacterium]MCY3651516.1 ABC transporter ATP-binding protein [bacterium]MDE0644022.1 ABC transporter ATP-binding protein [bacterium]MYD03664.1 ABC transporter ATP-binding protein [Acidimicrobiia bacterium]